MTKPHAKEMQVGACWLVGFPGVSSEHPELLEGWMGGTARPAELCAPCQEPSLCPGHGCRQSLTAVPRVQADSTHLTASSTACFGLDALL